MTRAAALAALIGAPVLVAAQSASTDFARGAEIRLDGTGSIFRLLVPDEVYDTVTRADLGDIRVLNAAGETVPHTLRQAPRPANPEAEWRVVPSFPMTEPLVGAGPKTQVRIGSDGTVLEVSNEAATGTTTSAYLVDASALAEPVAGMSLSWDAPPDVTFLARVTVQSSNDLDRWRTVVPSAAIAQLQRDAYTLRQREIELPEAEAAKYFRISWPKELAAVTLTSIGVRPPTVAAQRETRWRTLGAAAGERTGTVVYDTRGFLPIEYIDLEFPDATDAASVRVLSRADPSSEWRERHSGVFYSLQEGNTALRSQPARIARTSDRYWSAERVDHSGWRPERAPRLKVGWHPHELLFLAQGAAPYTLVYGSARTEAANAPVDAVLSNLTEADRTSRVRPATVGASRSLGGDAARKAPIPVRQLALWGVLVAAVAALGVVALRLLRDAAPSE